MLVRENFEKNYRRIFSEHKYGSTIWSPLASGVLSGKYNDGNIPEGSRFDKNSTLSWIWNIYFKEGKEATSAKLQKLGEIAKEFGTTQATLALAWAIANKDVSTCLLGFSKLSQVDENLKAMEIYRKWNKDIEKKIRDVLGNEPEVDMDFEKWAPLPMRRDEALKLPQ